MQDTMYLKKIETFEELDAILPMIESFHKTQKYCGLFSHSAYLRWLTLNFPLPHFGVWVVYDEDVSGQDVPIAYAIAYVQDLHDRREALLYEVFSEMKYCDMKKEALHEIFHWAEEHGCSLLSCYTENPKVVDVCVERYGFELNRFYLTKKLGV